MINNHTAFRVDWMQFGIIVNSVTKDGNPVPLLIEADNLVDIITRHPGNAIGIDCHAARLGEITGIKMLRHDQYSNSAWASIALYKI